MKSSAKRGVQCRNMTESFSQLPVGADFYCFGERWSKVTARGAVLNRHRGRFRTARVFAESELVRHVRGSDEPG